MLGAVGSVVMNHSFSVGSMLHGVFDVLAQRSVEAVMKRRVCRSQRYTVASGNPQGVFEHSEADTDIGVPSIVRIG